jgi:hypothetical protein
MSSREAPEKNAELSLLFLYESRPGQHPAEPTLVRAVTGYGRPPLRTGPERLILPRSRHRPRASTTAASHENINKTGVQFWTDRPEPPPKHRIKIAWTRSGLL